ncbi:hypothetical protein MNBD_BACTEROID05-186 [hydrothermal vent metagenome]|uniref:Uncharacterized protein n=1 Tax=hydrothermal vent metagenome TaxID=652676 RepID=A0A3B0TUJ8_9ZZZZ
MGEIWSKFGQSILRGLTFVIVCFVLIGSSNADVYFNVLTVNGTDSPRERKIRQGLPPELSREDILETDGLELEYDVTKGSYFVVGTVKLEAKETKTYKVRVRDIWKIEKEDVEDVKTEIDASLKRIKNTKFYEVGKVRQKSLLDRLNFVIGEQEKFADDVNKRIDRYRVYSDEINEIRGNALSVQYWRTAPPEPDKSKIFTYIVEVENRAGNPRTTKEKHYLPSEVKPEHLLESSGFELRYDVEKGKSYLYKEEELASGEQKRYRVGIVDVWNIAQGEIESLRERTRVAYKLLKDTNYVDSAGYLVKSIKKGLLKIDESQSVDRPIEEHISAYRSNSKLYQLVKADVESLENLLNALRENLERSKLKNVLKKVSALKNIKKISQTIFRKPKKNTAWMLISSMVIFVGILTIIHFILWGRRSKNITFDEEPEEEKKEEKTDK